MLVRLSLHKHGMKWTAIGLVLFFVAGCAPTHVSVRPQASDVLLSKDDDVLTAFHRVPEIGAGGIDVRVGSPGVSRHKHKGDKSVSITVDVLVENRSELTIASFDPRSVVLDAGLKRDLHPVAPIVSGSTSDTTAVVLEPGARRSFRLEFVTHATGDPRELTPFTLRLVLDYGGREYPVSVTFERQYYQRYTGYYYGYDAYPGYYYGYPGYYGYGYPYGPRFGVGAGYYGGW